MESNTEKISLICKIQCKPHSTVRFASINGVNILLILFESALCIIATILISRKIKRKS